MNIEALFISFCIIVIIILITLGIIFLRKKDIKINKFSPGWKDDSDSHSKYENIKKGNLTILNRLLLILIVGLLIGFIVYAITGRIIMSVFSFLLGFMAPNIWFKWYLKNQETLITQQMEQAAETMATVLKSNGSMISAIEKAAREAKEPLKNELSITAMELRLGISSTDAFMSLAKRVNLPEMLMLNIGIELQQRGMAINTANMLLQMQKNIRQRQLLQQEIKTITAENKMAGWIVGAIPFITIALMRQLSPEFTEPLLNTTIGLTIFAVCSVIILFGIYWVISMTNMDKAR